MMVVFGVVVMALPVVSFPYVATQDGGGHYNTAMVLARLESGAGTFFDHYFQLRPTPLANQFASRVMAWLAQLGFAAAAERIAWLLIFTAFSAVVVGNLWILRRDASVYALMFFPIFMGSLVNMGFMNFLFGMVLFTQSLFWLQFGLRRPSIVWSSGMLLLAIAAYIAHPLAGFALGACAGSFAAGYLALWALTARGRAVRVEGSFSLLVPLGCGLACVALVALAASDALPQIKRFIGSLSSGYSVRPSPSSLAAPVVDGLRQRAIDVLGFSNFVSYSPADYCFSAAFALVAIWLAWRRVREYMRERVLRQDDVWLASIALLFVLAMVVSRRFELFLPQRLSACLICVGALWLSTTQLDRAATRWLLLIGLTMNAGFLLWRLDWTESITKVLAEYASVGPHLPDNVTLLSIRSPVAHHQSYCRAIRPRRLPCEFRPALHFMANVIGERNIALLSNYQLDPQTGFFPIAARRPWSQYVRYARIYENWPRPPDPIEPYVVDDIVDLLERNPVDVIVTWDEFWVTGGPERAFPEAAQAALRNYTKVFTSSPLGVASVYIRTTALQRGPPPSAGARQ